MLRSFVILFFLSLAVQSTEAMANLVNRNLLDVDKAIYTHRDFIIWSLATEALFFREHIDPQLPHSKNWDQLKNIYLSEMIINHHIDSDSDRYSSFIPNGSMVAEAYRIVKRNIDRNQKLKNIVTAQRIAVREIKLQLAIVLKVQRFLKNKSFSDSQKTWKYKVEKNALWFERLMGSTPYRFFDGANNYQKPMPLP